MLLLSTRFISKCLAALGLLHNLAMAEVIPKKTTAQLRDRDGKPAEKVAVLLLGFKSNHPFGIFAPGFKEIGDYFYHMSVELSEGAADNGCKSFLQLSHKNSLLSLHPKPSKTPSHHTKLTSSSSSPKKTVLGQTSWSSKDRTAQNPELLNVSYWRDLDAVHAFAHSPLHRAAWDYWNRTFKAHPYLGVHHEVYEADAGRWESVYANFQPTGLGATSYLRRPDGPKGSLDGGVVADEWVTPLLPANKGKLSTSVGRLGRGKGDENDKYGDNVYL